MIAKDIRHPFSNAYRVNELLANVPDNEKMVTDYWAMNTVAAFSGKSLYCIDLEKEVSFIQWGPDLAAIFKKQGRYSAGVKNLFQKEGINKIFMVSTRPTQNIFQTDPKLPELFLVKLVDKIEGAINKGGNLYLYEISSK